MHYNDIDRVVIYRLLAMYQPSTNLIYPLHNSMGVRTRVPLRGLEHWDVEKESNLTRLSQWREEQSWDSNWRMKSSLSLPWPRALVPFLMAYFQVVRKLTEIPNLGARLLIGTRKTITLHWVPPEMLFFIIARTAPSRVTSLAEENVPCCSVRDGSDGEA